MVEPRHPHLPVREWRMAAVASPRQSPRAAIPAVDKAAAKDGRLSMPDAMPMKGAAASLLQSIAASLKFVSRPRTGVFPERAMVSSYRGMLKVWRQIRG